jgi:glyceraldehyde-3-phosphate dehydrogenase/erythrose-4-phosphate dehydrogenase
MFVMGVNEKSYKPDIEVLSNASCEYLNSKMENRGC